MVSPIALPFQKVCENCHMVGVIIFPIGNVHYNACCSKSTIQKSGFLHGSIATNDECIFLTIKGKWLETIMHMTESEFLDLFCLGKGKFSYIDFTSSAQHNFKCNIFLCEVVFQCKEFLNVNNFFNESSFSM
jgi:hypothetical protein